MVRHALLSASSSDRWIHCPPSARLCADLEDVSSEYAAQGTDAHALCEHLVKESLGWPTVDPAPHLSYYDEEMLDSALAYRDFVISRYESAKEYSSDPLIMLEQRLDYSKYVPEGFGTGDCIIFADDVMNIIDFKYGLGVIVNAKENTQLMCYALGALESFGYLYGISRVMMTIFQPRRGNIDTWEMSVKELHTWAEKVLMPAARLAYEGKGSFRAGSHCRFCKVKQTCRTRAEHNMELLKYEFKEPPLLSNEEIADILKAAEHLSSWANDVKDYALSEALTGVKYPGFKVVAGKANRKFTDEEAVASALLEAGYDPYAKKLLSITALSRKLGKKTFEELLGSYITKPKGSPVLVEDSDKRPDYFLAAEEFKENNDNKEEN